MEPVSLKNNNPATAKLERFFVASLRESIAIPKSMSRLLPARASNRVRFRGFQKSFPEGFSLLEIVVAVGIAALVIFSLGKVNETALRLSSESADRVEASLLLNEGVEAMKFLRDKSWSQNIAPLSTSETYYLTFATTTYAIGSAAPDLIDGIFARTINISGVTRDAQDTIAPTGVNDSSTRKVTVTVSWQNRDSYSEKVEIYLSDIYQN